MDTAKQSLSDAMREREAIEVSYRDNSIRKSSEPNLGPEEMMEKITSTTFNSKIIARLTRCKQAGRKVVKFKLDMDIQALYRSQPFIQVLLRLGHHVVTTSERKEGGGYVEIWKVFAVGHAPTLAELLKRRKMFVTKKGEPHLFLYGNSPRQLRLKGVVKCVPRLLGWLRTARIALTDPVADAHAEVAAAAVEASELDNEGKTAAERRADDQATRKRKVVEAVFADEDELVDGWRWFGIKKRRPEAKAYPMRIEAVHGDVFCFSVYARGTDNPMEIVQLLHRDEFDVVWQNADDDDPGFNDLWHGGDLERKYWHVLDTRFYENWTSDEDEEGEEGDSEDED